MEPRRIKVEDCFEVADWNGNESLTAARKLTDTGFHLPNTTVVDRRLAAENRAFGSGSEERGTDDTFAIGTSAADAQRCAIRARAGE